MSFIKEKIESIEKLLPPKSYGLICFSSFEERCLSVPIAISSYTISKAFILCNCGNGVPVQNMSNAKLIKDKIKSAEIMEIDIENPVFVSDCMMKIISTLIEKKIKNLLIDISTFTHETLLILLRLLYENNMFDVIYCLYNGAVAYSVGDKKEEVWLSKGCKDVRNVIGFPGIQKPSQNTHVIILSGFEIERATRLLELLEPDILSLGDGMEPTDSNHEDLMNYFKEKFLKWKKSFQNNEPDSFKFSCCDVEKTVNLLTSFVERNPKENYIIVPLNTKLSTLAVGIVALRKPDIQVCYAIPEMYNVVNYSKPSNNITLIALNEFDEFRKEN